MTHSSSFALVFAATALVAVSASPAVGSAGFGDIPGGAYYTAPVQWMVDEGITNGTTESCFSPLDVVSRGQVAAFMWRMEGEPTAPAHQFADVVLGYQQEAVSWMSDLGITTGTSVTTFSPDDIVTRGQIAAFLHRLAGEPVAPPHSFVDVASGYQQQPVSWMSSVGITTGLTETMFGPDAVVTRAQVATFFYRYKDEPTVAIDAGSPACGGSGGTAADEEFDGGATNLLTGAYGEWMVRNGDQADRIDVDSSEDGALVIVPTEFHHNGWYATNEGPFVYREITGNFAVSIRISVLSAADNGAGAMPGPNFNSGGFVVRDPDSSHDWVMYNMGNQSPGFGYGREVKTTVNGSSVLNLYGQTELTHRLLVCRVGSELHYFHGSANGSEWTEEVLSHTRPDFGDTLEVGIIANAWDDGPRPWVQVESIHFGNPSSVSDCTNVTAGV